MSIEGVLLEIRESKRYEYRAKLRQLIPKAIERGAIREPLGWIASALIVQYFGWTVLGIVISTLVLIAAGIMSIHAALLWRRLRSVK